LVVLSPNNSRLLLFLSELSPDTDIDFWTTLYLYITRVHFSPINCNGTVFFSKEREILHFTEDYCMNFQRPNVVYTFL
jgi:hypothetical protein